MKILIPTDGSRDAQIALKTGLRLLSPGDRNIDLIHVAPVPRPGLEQMAYGRRASAQSSEILRRACSQIGVDAQAVRLIALSGSPAAMILARAQDYDLTILGPKGHGAGANAALGPVASRVLEHTMAPVLIGREFRSETGSRILIAADGSRASISSIQTLVRLFDLRGSEITLMHIRETPWIHMGLDSEWDTSDEEDREATDSGVLEKEMTREGSAIVEQARDLLVSTGAAIETILEEGNPADEILSESDRGQFDLIVVGACANRDLKHSMLGSVSFKVAWNASCSVLIVREPV